MAEQKDKHLALVEQELRFIGRQAQQIEGANSADFDAVDQIGMAVESALRGLAEYQSSLRPEAAGEALAA